MTKAVILHHALILSDLHLGWIPILDSHERLLLHLPAAVADAPVIILNGDIIDSYRVSASAQVVDLIARFVALVARWRHEGRQVIYIEGNHDTQEEARGALRPDRWYLDCEGVGGERIRVLHGHRLSDRPQALSAYERMGRIFLRQENQLYAHSRAARSVYPWSVGWLMGAIGYAEDHTWRPSLIARVQSWDFDRIVHGHFHYGPGRLPLGRQTLHRSGAWVSCGHQGSVDRLLRYRRGRFERLALVGSRWQVTRDGR